MDAEYFDTLPGGADLRALFGGHVPSFHDGEVLSIAFDRNGPSCELKIHAFGMTDEIDESGFFILENHVVVAFRIEGLTGMKLDEFNHQNAPMGLRILRSQTEVFGGAIVDVVRLELDPAYGLGGFIEGRTLSINHSHGIPSGSQYERTANGR